MKFKNRELHKNWMPPKRIPCESRIAALLYHPELPDECFATDGAMSKDGMLFFSGSRTYQRSQILAWQSIFPIFAREQLAEDCVTHLEVTEAK